MPLSLTQNPKIKTAIYSDENKTKLTPDKNDVSMYNLLII